MLYFPASASSIALRTACRMAFAVTVAPVMESTGASHVFASTITCGMWFTA